MTTNDINQTPVEQTEIIERQEDKETNTKPIKWVQIRLIPIWLRILLLLLLLVATVAIGVIVGYSYIGDGEAGDALKWSTWQHILDIKNGKE